MAIPQQITLIFSLILLVFSTAQGEYGASIDGSLKYKKDFNHFDYTDPEIKKGGRVVLHDIGSFDKMNPFTLRGRAPDGVESLVFEPLAVSSLDEPFSQYGHLAKNIEVAADKLSVVFTLDPAARFSDGSLVTSGDVGYSLDLFKGDLVHPYYNYYYEDISGYEILGKEKIRILFKTKNRELHLIAGQMKVLPQAKHDDNGFTKVGSREDFSQVVGSGPYLVDGVRFGKSVTYVRDDTYWAKDKPTRRGMFNFDEIVVKFFKDQVVALEAFKAGEYDFLSINIAKQWARNMKGKKFDNGTLVKKTYPHLNNAGMQGFLMNTRRDLFKDRLVRKALGMALDFHWVNRSLFHDQYTRNNSYFSNSYLAASGLPQGLELDYLSEFKEYLPQEIFTQPLSAPESKNPQEVRKNLLEAKSILDDAGWHVKDGILQNEAGQKFEFEIILSSPAFERVMASYTNNLRKLGIIAKYRTIDSALYIQRLQKFDFDMIVKSYGQSLSPGNEQRNYWHSDSGDSPGSYNYAGIDSPVVDAMVDLIIYSTNRNQLVAACRALDRVLWYGYYVVPNWFLDVHRLGYRDIFTVPAQLPLYYDPFQLLMTWGVQQDKF